MQVLRCARERRESRGAAAVEFALMAAFVLVPLVMGVLYYGMYFWKAQAAGAIPSTLPTNGINGRFATCGELVTAVKNTLVGVSPNITGTVGDPLQASDIVVSVVELLPVVGAVVKIQLTIPVLDELGGLLPLPNGGAVVTELTTRLDNVVVTTGTC